MKFSRWLVLFIAVTIMVTMVVGCGTQPAAPAPEPAEEEEEREEAPAAPGITRLSIASGWVVGVYYPLAGAISRIINNTVEGVKTTVESSGASVANAKLIGSGEADLAILQNDIAYYAYTGTQMFDQKIDNIRGVFCMYPEHIQIVATKASGIKSVADMAGKRVSVGPLGSGTEANTLQILEAYGLTFNDLGTVERLAAAEASDYLRDNRIDAAFYTTGVGAAAIADLALVSDITVVPVDSDKIEWLKSTYPFYAQATVPEGVYRGVPETQTVAVLAIMTARAEIPEDMMYNIVKAVFNDLETLGTAHARGKDLKLETALEGMPIPLHPGAEKYFKEQGIK